MNLPFRRLLQLSAALLVLTGITGAQPARTNPFIGRWKLNVGRSTFPDPPPQGYFNLRQYEEMPDGSVAHTMLWGTSGTGDLLVTVARWDGNEFPVYNAHTLAPFLANGTKPVMTVTFKRVDEHTIEYTDRVSGRISSHGPCSVSPDGSTLTIVSHALDPGGKERSLTTLIYERQTK